MAKSLLNQFTQTRGSRNYIDTLTMTLSEIAGKSKAAGLTVDITGNNTVTDQGAGAFSNEDLGGFIVIAGVAYEITGYTSATVVTVGGSPANDTGVSAALHYRQNLEDDLNYIRTQLELIVGEVNWFDEPDITLSGVNYALDNLTATFSELTDTYGFETYTADQMLYTSSSGVHGTSDMSYDPDTGDIQMGATGGARVSIDADTQATVYGDDDTYMTVSGTDTSFVEGGTLRMSLTADGLMLTGGARVNDTLNVADGDAIDASSTDAQLATAALIHTTITGALAAQDEHNELGGLQGGDTGEYYHLDSADYTNLTASGTPTYMYYVGSDGRRAETSDMTYDVSTGDIALGSSTGDIALGAPSWSDLGAGNSLTTITDTVTVMSVVP